MFYNIFYLKNLAYILRAKNHVTVDFKGWDSILTDELPVKEPSGLCFSEKKDVLLTVSDKTGKIYFISTQGKVLSEIDFKGKDIEGITYDKKSRIIYVVEEKAMKITALNFDGETLNEYKLPKISDDKNSGLEGITYNSAEECFYLLVKKNPGYFIKWSPEKGIIFKNKLQYAEDFSGISYDNATNSVWIVSDKSKTLTNCDLSGNPLETFPIPVKQAEGIAVLNNTFYIVSDEKEKLYVFEK